MPQNKPKKDTGAGKGLNPHIPTDHTRSEIDRIFSKTWEHLIHPDRGIPLLEPDGYTHQTICFCDSCKTKGHL